MKLKYAFIFIVCTFLSCDKKTIFNEDNDLKDGKWFIKNELAFKVDIIDATQPYNIYYKVRNSLIYPFYNLYITRTIFDEKGKKLSEKLDEIILADEKTGEPKGGEGLGDIYDHKVLMLKTYKFPANGKYTFKIKQSMRQNPLSEVISVGLLVEKL
jgi:gliding motility-associated lipoprotein GldH